MVIVPGQMRKLRLRQRTLPEGRCLTAFHLRTEQVENSNSVSGSKTQESTCLALTELLKDQPPAAVGRTLKFLLDLKKKKKNRTSFEWFLHSCTHSL